MSVHSPKKTSTFEAYRNQFRESSGYLDFARIGPISDAVTSQKMADIERLRFAGPSNLSALDLLGDAARTATATLLNATAQEVAFVSSTSHGLFAAALSLGPAQGTILVPRNDFPANTYPWIRTAERGGLAVRWIDGPVTADTIRASLDSEVKAVAVSAVDAGTGALAPLAQIKDVIGEDRTLVVDAVQALGAVEFDVEAADILAAGGQKWLRAGWGAAALLIRSRVADRLQPGLGGWSGVTDPLGVEEPPHPTLPGAIAHTLTNPDSIAVSSYGVAVNMVLSAGLREINAAICENLGALLDTVLSSGGEVRNISPTSGIGIFRMPGIPTAELFTRLSAAGIHTTRRGDWIRLSPHASTTHTSVRLLQEALSSLRVASSH